MQEKLAIQQQFCDRRARIGYYGIAPHNIVESRLLYESSHYGSSFSTVSLKHYLLSRITGGAV
ncbi:hypothetical protein RVY52_003392 [Burkholderia cenocepacia]|nr:hypothetical protein [Burkholderia cenocepacia]